MKRPLSIVALLLLVGCSSDTVEVGEEPIGVETINQVMPVDGKAVHPQFGAETWFAYGAIEGTNGNTASGVGQAYRFENGSYVLTLQANLPTLGEGKFYEAWIKNPETGDMRSVGHLSNFFGDARHTLTFDSTEDLSTFTEMSISLERDDGNPQPGSPMAKGTLKPTER
jgi:hypothetical protein